MTKKNACKGLSRSQCKFGKGLANTVDSLIDVKGRGVKRYVKKYRT